MNKRFQRKTEDFTCINCRFFVRGSGYTNHCSECLWSRHVDVNPGDREEECRGMMRPVSIEQKEGEWRIIHKCEKCGKQKPNKLSSKDSEEVFRNILDQETE